MIRQLWILCIFFVGCSNREIVVQKQVMRIGIESDPKTLDPRKCRDLCGSIVLKMLFEGLTRTSKDGCVEMGIAKSVEISEDGLTYTFTLRESKWSDGSDLTAADFVYAWRAILDPQFSSDVAYHLFPIKNGKKIKLGEAEMDMLGLHLIDSHTLRIELESPTPYFLNLLTMPAYFPVPERIVEKSSLWDLEASTLISNGPFQIESWDHADQIRLGRNSQYWEEGTILLEQVELCVTNPDTALRMFEEGKLDWVGSPLSTIPVDAMETLLKAKKLESSPFLATQLCRVNTAKEIRGEENPLSHKEYRKALASSLDRSIIVEHILRGGQKTTSRLVPSFMGLHHSLDLLDNDPEMCLFTDHPIVISYYNNERNTQIAQFLKQQWEDRLHLKVQIEAVEPKLYFQKIAKKEYQIAIGSWVADFNDPINFLEVFKYRDNGTNNTEWENDEYIDLLNRSQLCKSLEERREILEQAESILMDEMPIVPLYEFVLNYAKSDDLQGVSLSPEGHLDLRKAKMVTR